MKILPSPDSNNDDERSLTPPRRRFVLKRSEGTGSVFKIRYADELNAAQLAAVEQLEGPLLVVAGAGTGKTRTLVYRVARMIESGIPPESILLLTFTRRSAQEMLRRAALLVGARAEQVTGGTFHSFANLTLRQYGQTIGLSSNFTILDQGDAEDVINLLRGQRGLDARGKRFPRKNTLAAMFSASINRLRPLVEILDEEYPQYVRLAEEIEELARAYRDYKRGHGLLDYDDLLVEMVTLLEENVDLRARLARKHRYIMVDEYQDTNALQHRIVRLLGSEHRNVMAVGDDSQSIYSFRGADFRNIMEFPRDFPGCTVVTIEENYRSVQPILDVANEVLAGAAVSYEKQLYTRRTGGEKPVIISCADEALQSQFVAQRVLELREEGVELKEIAVLVRSSYLSFDLEIELNRAGIPYVKMGGFKFIETAHVKDMIAHLRVVHNPSDVVSWNRILLLLPGVGPRTAQRVVDAVLAGQLRLGAPGEETGRALGGEPVQHLLDTLNAISHERMSVSERVDTLTQYYTPILRGRYDDYTKRQKDVEMFGEIAARYRSLPSFLSDMALEPPTESIVGMEAGHEDEQMTISTIHSAKGLEWNTVFILWALDGRFPSTHAASSLDALEEERRLMYVATTRAKDRLIITYPINIFDRESGMVLSKPSRFIAGIPDELAERWVVADE